MTDNTGNEKMMDKMDLVFKLAKEKAIEKSSEIGNTVTPWKDFTPDWLKHRLVQEIIEWDKIRNTAELLDIINLAIFAYLAENEQQGNLLPNEQDEKNWLGLEALYGDLVIALIKPEILKIIDEMDTEFDFTALPRLFEGKLD